MDSLTKPIIKAIGETVEGEIMATPDKLYLPKQSVRPGRGVAGYRDPQHRIVEVGPGDEKVVERETKVVTSTRRRRDE
jgi:hypothetical protein